MKKVFRLNTLIMFFILSIVVTSAQLTTAETLEGDWVNENYLMLLKESQSPKAASAISGVPIVSIEKDEIYFLLGFHESAKYKIKSFDEKTGNIILDANDTFVESIRLVSGNLNIKELEINKSSELRKFNCIIPFAMKTVFF